MTQQKVAKKTQLLAQENVNSHRAYFLNGQVKPQNKNHFPKYQPRVIYDENYF